MLKFSPKSQAGELIFNEIKGADLFEGYFCNLENFWFDELLYLMCEGIFRICEGEIKKRRGMLPFSDTERDS